MNPKPWVRLQAAATMLVSAAVVLALGSAGATATAPTLTVGLAVWAWFGVSYRRRRRCLSVSRSGYRSERDKVMVQCAVGGLALPALGAWIALGVGTPAVVAEPPVSGVLIGLCAVLIPLSILVSSSVDWYVIRAWRDGVTGRPACQAYESEASVAHLRYWVMHRFACEVVVWLSVAFGIALTSAVAEEATSGATGRTVLELIGLAGIIGWSARELANLRPALDFIRYPCGAGLGSWVTGVNSRGQEISGFMLDVALDHGLQLTQKPLGRLSPDVLKREHCVPLRERERLVAAAPPSPLCAAGCEFWLPACEVGLTSAESAPEDQAAPVG